MPPVPSEPENYSIDDMMDRLKRNPSPQSEEAGERVTRADGTEVIKVRKRKRRSDQPKKELQKQVRRTKVIQIISSTLFIVLALIGAGIALAYANSPPFRDSLLKKITYTSGATPTIETLRVNPRTANAGRLTLEWPKGNTLDTLTTTGIIAEISPTSLAGKSITGQEVTTSNSILKLRLPEPDQPMLATASGEHSPLSFERFRTPKLDISFAAIRTLSLSGAEASLGKNSSTNRTQLSLKGGALRVPDWPNTTLERAFIEFRGNEMDVVSLTLVDPSGSDGMFEFSGTVAPYAPDIPSSLGIEVKDFPITTILGPDLEKLFNGRIDSIQDPESNTFTFFPSATPNQKLSLSFRKTLSSVFEISKFPFLFSLSRTLEDEWFRQPQFLGDEVSATIIRENGSISIQNINFQSKGRMALRGNLKLSSTRALSGTLEVGIAENMIIAAENSPRLRTLFSPVSDGYCWLFIRVKGNGENPDDDFKDLFLATPNVAPKNSPESDYKSSTFEELTKPR